MDLVNRLQQPELSTDNVKEMQQKLRAHLKEYTDYTKYAEKVLLARSKGKNMKRFLAA